MLRERTRSFVKKTLAALNNEEIFEEIAEFASSPQAKLKFEEMLKLYKSQLEATVTL